MSAPRFTRLHEYGLALFLITVLACLIVPTVGNVCGYKVYGAHDAANLRQLAQASFIYAQDHQDRLPEATDVWDYARLLAEGGGLDNAQVWQSTRDPATASTYNKKGSVLRPRKDGQPRALNPAFRSIKPAFAIPVGRRLSTNHPATTPVAWARGLQSDGTWALHNQYKDGTAHHIVFLGGNVAPYLNLTDDGGQLIARDGSKTANVLEALPSGCRISEYLPTPEEQIAWSQPPPPPPQPHRIK